MKDYKTNVNIDILKKYNRPGPRYTSYPTAPHFHDNFGAEQYHQQIIQTNQENPAGNVSLYFHFPFCSALCHFCACNVIITHNRDRITRYLSYLKKEIDMISAMIHPNRKVTQLHWGGGTPTYLTTDEIRDIFGYIKSHFNFARDAEISIEIDPRSINKNHLSVLREIGFNRTSFGVQDFNKPVQEAINRVQTDEQNQYVIDESRRLKFDSVNIDLMYGLPHQSLASYQKTIDQVLELDPDRLAVFNYAHVPWLKKHQNLLSEDAMPKAQERLDMLKLVIERLTGAGYVYIGMDHFAKPDDELSKALKNHTLYRNFQGYSTNAQAEIYAMGVSSISQLYGAYAQNVKKTKEYEAMLDAGRLPTQQGYKLNNDDQIRRYVITEIMCNNRILKADVHNRFGIDFDSYFSDIPEKLEKFLLDGLVEFHPDRIQVSDDGRLVIRNIAMLFDAYLGQTEDNKKPVFSRTI